MLSKGHHDCRYWPAGSGWGDWRVQVVAEVPHEPVERWRVWKVERQDGASLDGCSEENQPCSSEVCSQDCGTCCSVLGCLL